MLPKNCRFSLKSQKKKNGGPFGKRFRGPFFNLLITYPEEKDEESKIARFAFVVSSKVAKKAAKRNRLKRLLREAVWQLLPQTQPGFCVVVFAQEGLMGKSLTEIKREMKKAFSKTGIIQKTGQAPIGGGE